MEAKRERGKERKENIWKKIKERNVRKRTEEKKELRLRSKERKERKFRGKAK